MTEAATPLPATAAGRPDAPPDVSAIVINYNGGEHLRNCLRSIVGQECLLETIVVDNASSDGSLDAALAEFPDVVPLRDDVNRGRAVAPNRGAALARGDILVFLDHDVILEPGCLRALAADLRTNAGVAGPVLRNGPERVEQWGMTVDWLGYPRGLRGPGTPLFINGPVVATNRSLFEQLGGFERRFFYAAEDLDYGWRVLLGGHRVAIVPAARATHLGGGGGTTPGGYARRGRFETTHFRIVMRERNTMAVFLSCAPPLALTALVPAYVARMVAMSAAALVMGRPGLAEGLVRGMAWNVGQLPATLRRRRSIPRTRAGEREARRRMHRGLHMATTLRRYGLPRFVAASPPGQDP